MPFSIAESALKGSWISMSSDSLNAHSEESISSTGETYISKNKNNE